MEIIYVTVDIVEDLIQFLFDVNFDDSPYFTQMPGVSETIIDEDTDPYIISIPVNDFDIYQLRHFNLYSY